MGTLFRMRINIFKIRNQPNFKHESSIRLHFRRKTENCIENLKIRKYPFFTFSDKNIIKVIQNDVHMERFCKNRMATVKYT